MTICYLTATQDDLPEIVSLLASCGLPTQDSASLRLDDFITAKNDAGLAGVVGLERQGEDALLRSLAVQSTCSGSGIGAKLVQAIEHHAKKTGVSHLYLLTISASRFFARIGYQEIARSSAPASIQATVQFMSLCSSQAVCMTRKLN